MNTDIFYSSLLQQSFNRDGIIGIPFLTTEEISSLIELYHTTSNRISERKFHSTMFINNSTYRKQIDAGIKKIILLRLSDVVNNYRMLFANFIVKESSENTRVGIHQDWNFTSPQYTSVNFWIPLVDINLKTGLFYALKGGHRIFHNIRFTPYEDNSYAGLEEFIQRNATPFYVKAGNALFYHGALVHYSDPNVSNALRIAVGGVMIPAQAPNLHYYKPERDKNTLEIYEVNEEFYHGFDFFTKPKGVKKNGEMQWHEPMPTLNTLIQHPF